MHIWFQNTELRYAHSYFALRPVDNCGALIKKMHGRALLPNRIRAVIEA